MWDTIKKIIQKQGGTCIIIEEGKPAYVVTSFNDFQTALEKNAEIENLPIVRKANSGMSEQELLEKINQEITNWKVAQTEEQAAEQIEEETEGGIRIEDLPL